MGDKLHISSIGLVCNPIELDPNWGGKILIPEGPEDTFFAHVLFSRAFLIYFEAEMDLYNIQIQLHNTGTIQATS